MPELAVWSIFFAPLASFLFIALSRPILGAQNRLSGRVTVVAVAASFFLSLAALSATIQAEGHNLGFQPHDWLAVGGLTIRVGIVVDSLTAVMAVVVTGVSLLVQIYGQEYMKGDRGYARYYAAMSLFTASMLGLIMASNLVLLFVFWELVGLCSFLLIGHWYERPAAADAAKKAFIVTRFGDLGFLIGIVWAYRVTGTLEIVDLNAMAATGALAGAALTWPTLGIFAGAMGKSGQFPLHVWLPDAMEGPTPVSALIHAATMVAAGVFLVARMYPLFEASATALTVVAWVGAFTAIFAATMALVANDLKRVMAFSTVSQLGYMMLALGVGAVGAAIFHLFNHAFFKALLFLGAGSVQHTTGTYNMRYLGGLRKAMPLTFATLLVGSLSLSGIPAFSGFWSKDAILDAAQKTEVINGAELLFLIGLVTAFLTAFYVFRMMMLTFWGEYRGGAAAEAGGHGSPSALVAPHPHLHEPAWMMALPLAVLALPALVSGAADLPVAVAGIPAHWMTDFLGGHPHKFDQAVAVLSTAAAGSGMVLAFLVYGRRATFTARVGSSFAPVYRLLVNRYYMDRLYEDVFVRKVLYSGIARGSEWVDVNVIDRVVNTLGWLGRNLGRAPAQLQTGQVQAYGAVATAGLVVLVIGFWVWG
ncbi:MAG: NADH-ubiquinone oxidoreductase chain [Dehalococcoidia bacterium]|nr:NADH-ubiquinone oxidoreductase chain [Dehalococcoidia bacterium]